MLNGMMMNGMSMIGVRIGLVLLMIGLVTGLGSEDDWSYWSDDWSWGSQDWWGAEQPSASASSGFAKHCECPTKSEPSQNVAAVTVGTQDQNAARTFQDCCAKPGMMTNRFVGSLLC